MNHLKNTVGYQIMLLKENIIEETKDEFKKSNITHEEYITLHYIYENPGITQVALAKINRRDNNVISKRIDKLEQKNFVERIRDTDKDRRAFYLYLTEKGNAIIDEYWHIFLDGETRGLKNLSADEKIIFKNLLQKIILT